MPTMPAEPAATRRPLPRDWSGAQPVLWLCLVTLAVVGRLWQPTWNGEPLWHVTPLAAVSLAAGVVFRSSLVAATVPLAALAITNFVLPAYCGLAMALVVAAATAWPVVLGRCGLLGGIGGRTTRWSAVIGGALASALVFYLVTNTAHWLLTADYPRTVPGLGACLAAGLPFFRPWGDVGWTVILFSALNAVAALLPTAILPRPARAVVPRRPLD